MVHYQERSWHNIGLYRRVLVRNGNKLVRISWLRLVVTLLRIALWLVWRRIRALSIRILVVRVWIIRIIISHYKSNKNIINPYY